VVSRFVSGKRVLEVGCGAGLGLNYISRGAASVTAGDLSLDNLKYAGRRSGGKVDVVRFDAHHMPFEDGCFDVVAALQVIPCLDVDRFLDECRRVLKKGGILVIDLPNRDRPYFSPSSLSRGYLSAPDLFDALDSHGFDARVYGAFPVPEGAAWSLWQKARNIAGKTLNLLPAGKRLKAFLAGAASGADMTLGDDIGRYIDGGILEGVDICPVSHLEPNDDYQILCAISQAR